MRKRRWALFAFIFLVAFLFGAMETWRFFQVNESLRRIVLRELRPVFGQALRIKRVHLGFGNLHLLDVQFKDPDVPVQLTIKDLRLGYSLLNLLVHGFDVKRLSHDALLVEASFIVSLPQLQSLLSSSPNWAEENSEEGMSLNSSEFLRHFNFISVRKCRLLLAVDDSTYVEAAHNLEGGLFRYKNDSLSIDLSGYFAGSNKKNILINGRANVRSFQLDRLAIALKSFDLQNGIPYRSKFPFQFESGKFSAFLKILADRQAKRYEITAEGELSEASGWFYQKPLEFRDLFFRFVYQNDTLALSEGVFSIADSPVTFDGKINFSGTPQISMEILSPRLSLSDLRVWPEGKSPQGIISLHAEITGDPRDPLLDVETSSEKISFDKMTAENLTARFQYSRGRLACSALEGDVFRHRLRAGGTLRKEGEEIAISGIIAGRTDSLFHTFLGGQTIYAEGSAEAQISGTISEPIVNGIYSLIPSHGANHSRELPIKFTYAGSALTLESLKNQELPSFNAAVVFSQSEPIIKADIRGLEKFLHIIELSKPLSDLIQGTSISCSLEGVPSALHWKASVVSISGDQENQVVLNIEADAGWKNKTANTKGFFRLYPDRLAQLGVFHISNTAEQFVLNELKFGNNLSATLDINRRKKQLKGRLDCRALDLAAFTNADRFQGKAEGYIQLEGPIDRPNFHGSLQLDDLIVSGLGPYQVVAGFTADQEKIKLNRLLLNAGSATLIFAQGFYDRFLEQLDLSIKGAGFRLENIRRLVDREALVSGQALIDLNVKGKPASPKIQGIIALKDGHVLRTPFDELEIRLKKEETDNARLRFDSIRLLRREVYQITAAGYWPFLKNDSLAFDVDGSGNLLTVLSDADKFFKKPKSNGVFSVKLRGTPENPRILAAELKISDASLEFGSVIPPVNQIQALIKFSPETGIFKLHDLSGLMGGEPFRIYSEAARMVPCKRPLEDFSIGDGLFRFGVLILETPGNGVPLNFVGLMEPQKFGVLKLLGRENGEKFYFASTDEGITLRGKILLSEAEIMYPFYESGKKPSEKVKRFLEHLIWDIAAIPQKNVRFARSFPAAIDEVYVNLKLDDRVGGLDFSGRIADETFRINGRLRSTKGFLEYLDMNFRLDQAGIDFDRSSLIPVVYGQARATITDSLGLSSNIFLTMQTVDNTMDKKSVDDIVRQEEGRARIDRIRFKLSSDNPMLGSNEAQVLAGLGYAGGNLRKDAVETLGKGADTFFLRPLFRPLERELTNALRLDYVRFSSPLTRNLLQFNLNNNLELNKRLALLQSTRIIVGKYLTDRLFLQYTGQLESGVSYRYKGKEVGFHHTVGLDYQINPQLLVELEYDYDSLMNYNRDDKRIVFRHWFPF